MFFFRFTLLAYPLILFNSIVMDGLTGGGISAVLISTFLVLIFGEIIPQAVCSKYGLEIGAFFAWPVRILTYLLVRPICS